MTLHCSLSRDGPFDVVHNIYPNAYAYNCCIHLLFNTMSHIRRSVGGISTWSVGCFSICLSTMALNEEDFPEATTARCPPYSETSYPASWPLPDSGTDNVTRQRQTIEPAILKRLGLWIRSKAPCYGHPSPDLELDVKVCFTLACATTGHGLII